MNNSTKNDICVFTVVYPEMEKWIPQFAESLFNQDFKDFDLIIVNDGLDLEKLRLLDEMFNCKILPSGGSIAKNRNIGFSNILKSGYSYVVFTDADDLMAKNRISSSKELLDHYEIVVNDLTLINPEGEFIMDKYFSRRLGNFRSIHPNEILDYNFIGLGNSSARVEILDNITIPEDIEAVDWYLFSVLLNRGDHAVFTPSTSTLYRQRSCNSGGFQPPDEDNIILFTEHKYLHYFYLQELSEHHQSRFKEFSNLLIKLKDPVFKQEYLEKINDQMPKFPFWFESIQPS